MSSSNPIKLIKRRARAPQLAQAVAGCVPPQSSAREKARGMAATVKEWISECRQARLARYQELEQRFGLRHDLSHDQEIE